MLYRILAAGLSLQICLHGAELPGPNVPTSVPRTTADATIIAQAQQREADAQTRNDISALASALNDEADARLRLRQFDVAEKLRVQVLHLEEQHAGRDSLDLHLMRRLAKRYGHDASGALERLLAGSYQKRLPDPPAV